MGLRKLSDKKATIFRFYCRKRELKSSVKTVRRALSVKTSDPNNSFETPYKTDSLRKLFQIQSQTLFSNTRNSFGEKMTVAFAVIFMAVIDKQLQTSYKPTETISLEKIH